MHYYLLTLSKNRACLLEVNGDTVHEKKIDGMPVDQADAWKGMEHQEKSLQFHSAGGGNAMFHGQGGAKDESEVEMEGYVHKVAKSLHTMLHGRHVPLVFAGVSELHGVFKKFDTSGCLLDAYVKGNADEMDGKELRTHADPIVKEYLEGEHEKLLESYASIAGTGRTSDDIDQIRSSAEAGKVDTLFIAEGKEDDCKDVISHTLGHRGRVVPLEAGHMPQKKDVVAILRL